MLLSHLCSLDYVLEVLVTDTSQAICNVKLFTDDERKVPHVNSGDVIRFHRINV